MSDSSRRIAFTGGGLIPSRRPRLPERVVRRVPRDLPLVLFDISCVCAAYLASLVLRFDGVVPDYYWRNFWTLIPLIAIVHLLANRVFGLYGRMWQYASVQEARSVVMAGASAGVVVFGITAVAGEQIRLLPLSVMIVGASLSLMGFGAIRFQSRLFAFRRRLVVSERRRILVVGAGEAGQTLVRDILRTPALGLDPVGILDDDGRKVGRSLHGVRVLAGRGGIPSLAGELEIDEVVLAIPSATSEVVRDVAAMCEEADVALQVLPPVRERVNARVTAREIRDLKIEDLLGRQQVEIDLDAVGEMLRGQRVLVTGAGGSIGAEIARQVATFDPSELFLLDHDETHLHDILTELEGTGAIRSLLSDVRYRIPILEAFMRVRPEIVFHAAAHKHVPLLELHPEEALLTNVVGTANVADAAMAAGTGRFVLISTDKAVKPISVMGASKWFAEQIMWSLQGNDCRFCAVRFGNVLGSRGSVVPTFFRQIRIGGPVTVTDPAMTRYFMSVQEAVQLVLQAAALSRGGEVFTLDMGEPVNIMDLAREVIRLSGRIPTKEVEISIVGARPGEKVIEDVVNVDEDPLPSQHPSIVVSQPQPSDRILLRRALRELESLSHEGRRDELASELKLLSSGALRPVAGGVPG